MSHTITCNPGMGFLILAIRIALGSNDIFKLPGGCPIIDGGLRRIPCWAPCSGAPGLCISTYKIKYFQNALVLILNPRNK